MIFIIKNKTKQKTTDLLLESGIPQVDLVCIDIHDQAANLITESLARKHILIPIQKNGSSLKVAMSDPLDIYAIDDLRRATKLDIEPLGARPSEISRQIDRVYGAHKARQIMNLFQDQSRELLAATQAREDNEALYDVTNSPMVKFVENIFDQAIAEGASDIHIEPSEGYVRIRLRIDGHLIELLKTDIGIIKALTARVKILAKLDIAERRLPQDGRINMTRGKEEIDMRVSILPTIYGEKTAIRLLYRTGMRLSMGQLGFHLEDEKKVRSLLQIPNGIILLTGPTGCGKSTTLASAIRELNKPNINIITIEDPVENVIEGVNQVAVNMKTKLSFAKVLRSILRQDPDIIMIGEMRDRETSDIAIRAAITGHLVLSTLHTNDATSSINRLVDMGLESYMIGSSVRGIIAQRLVRKICHRCKVGYLITKEEAKLTGIPIGTSVYKGEGCRRCNHLGYKGRFAVHEIFVTDVNMQDIISKNQLTSEELRTEAIKQGMRTLEDNTRWNVENGQTSVEEMLQITYEL